MVDTLSTIELSCWFLKKILELQYPSRLKTWFPVDVPSFVSSFETFHTQFGAFITHGSCPPDSSAGGPPIGNSWALGVPPWPVDRFPRA